MPTGREPRPTFFGDWLVRIGSESQTAFSFEKKVAVVEHFNRILTMKLYFITSPSWKPRIIPTACFWLILLPQVSEEGEIVSDAVTLHEGIFKRPAKGTRHIKIMIVV
jgi:hypothetical protein